MFMACLIIAGEAIFSLPFHLTRFFRSQMLEVFELTNTDLGAAQAVYGVLAMIAYFPGGPLADRFPARRLLAASLVLTAVSAIYFATRPGVGGLSLLFGYWGVTTILLFWAALIRATREWGSAKEQGRAYGILDGGRGVLAAGMASIAVFTLGALLPDPVAATSQEKLDALVVVIYGYAGVTLGAAVLCWFFVPETDVSAARAESKSVFQHIGKVLKVPDVWLMAIIVICAYVGYKGFDNYQLFAVQAYGLTDQEGSEVVALSAWVRPIAAVGAGLIGDKLRCSRVVIALFAILLVSDLIFAIGEPDPATASAMFLIANVVFACVAVFGLRGVYFALLEEARIPALVTGTAVGVISVVGYTPDIFVTLVLGFVLDATPGLGGHQHFFWFLAAFAGAGLVTAIVFERRNPGPQSLEAEASRSSR